MMSERGADPGTGFRREMTTLASPPAVLRRVLDSAVIIGTLAATTLGIVVMAVLFARARRVP